ncbi:MAG: hydrogenase small subunit [Clostridium sp.]
MDEVSCGCPVGVGPKDIAMAHINGGIRAINEGLVKKPNAIWLETSGCFGEVISLMNADTPDALYLLKELVNMEYFGSIMGDQGEAAYERILGILDTEFIFIICGAIPKIFNGLCARIATYKGEEKTAADVTKMLANKAKYIIAVGTCACYGGPTAARPNDTQAVSIPDFLGRNDVIRLPGCPVNPVWTLGSIGYLVNFGMPELDIQGRPVAYYGRTIHEVCPRRSFFDNGIFAEKLGEPECMFELGCKGPITKVYCPVSRWNSTENWPIGVNTPCIGCAGPGFPDKNEPFVRFGGSI